jgi:chromosome segregation ATPase
MSDLKTEMAELQSQNHSFAIEKAKLEMDVSVCLTAAARFFNGAVGGLGELTALMMGRSQVSKGEVSKIRSRYHQKLATARHQSEDTRAQLENFSRESDERIGELTRKVNSLTQAVEQHKLRNEGLQQQNESLTGELAQLKAKVRVESIRSEDAQSGEIARLTRQIGELSAKVNELESIKLSQKEKITNLTGKFQQLLKKAKAVQQKLAECEQSKEDIQQQSQRSQSLASEWEKRCRGLEGQIESFRKDNGVQRLEIERLRAELAESALEVSSRDKMIELARKEHEQIEQLLEKQKSLTAAYIQRQEEADVNAGALRTRLETVEAQLEIASKPQDLSQLIPLAAW